MDIPRTWATHEVAMRVARLIAKTTGQRQAVLCWPGRDSTGPCLFRIVPADVAEPCS